MFKTGTILAIKWGVLKVCNNGVKDISVRQLAKACGVSNNTIYKLWDVCKVRTDDTLVYIEGSFFKLFAYEYEGVKVFHITASGV